MIQCGQFSAYKKCVWLGVGGHVDDGQAVIVVVCGRVCWCKTIVK